MTLKSDTATKLAAVYMITDSIHATNGWDAKTPSIEVLQIPFVQIQQNRSTAMSTGPAFTYFFVVFFFLSRTHSCPFHVSYPSGHRSPLMVHPQVNQ